MSISRTDQKCKRLDFAAHFERLDLIVKLASRESLAAFVHGDAVASMRALQQPHGNAFGIARFHDDQLVAAEPRKTLQIILYAGLGVGQGGFAGDDDAEVHVARLIEATMIAHATTMNTSTICIFLSIPTLWMMSCATPQSDRIPESRIERQMMGFLEKFDRWDYNGDGKLTIGELNEAERISGVPSKDVLKFYDANQDGAITLREAQAAYTKRIEQRP